MKRKVKMLLLATRAVATAPSPSCDAGGGVATTKPQHNDATT